MTPLDWQADAACRTADPEIFFIHQGESAAPAKAICATCPVIEACRDFALTNRERVGIWGGMSAHERRDYLRTHDVPMRKTLAPHGSAAAIRRHQRADEPLCRTCQWALDTDNVAATVA